MCQYDEELEPYVETIKRIYKSLLRYAVKRWIPQGQSLVNYITVSTWIANHVSRYPSIQLLRQLYYVLKYQDGPYQPPFISNV